MLPNTTSIELPKRARRYGAKVKTGCITCKIRRVKCDEKKPNCLRCISTGRKCDGYAQNKKDFQFQALSLSQASSFRYTVPMFSGFDDNVHYLEFYHHCAGPTLSSKFDNEFWSRISLQMAQSEPAVRHALIALGYLHKTEPGNLKHARSGFAADHEPRTLLFHYNRSVRCLVDRMAEPSYSREVGLVTCVLFICIEFLRGNYHTAFTHLRSGLKIISEWQQGRLNGSPGSSLSVQPSLAISRCFSGPTTMIEDKLIPMFVRVIATALLYGVSIEQVFAISCPLPQDFRERPFMTVLEAQSSVHELRNPSILYVTTMAKKLILREPVTAEDLQYQMHLLECHRAWFRGLQILEREKHLSKEDKVTASSLKVSYYATSILVACAAEVNQMPYDEHIESFKALNYHAKIVLDSMNLSTLTPSSPSIIHSTSSPASSGGAMSVFSPKTSPAANFTFEISIIPSLYFTATRCRCPITRREAVSLLALNPPREGLWDAEQHLVVSNRVIEIEESEVDPVTGWPVETARLWSSVIDANMDRNGGFWVNFLSASWVEGKVVGGKSFSKSFKLRVPVFY
ncbi:hypothetical protein K469DRAFT_739026 [Zopfia rhizophila CBS 207.26]|uniref:Zn(2)-C6 fungal-type domain-containing protein n=1 Tax=Zopfia rhizophila CBS 207.26 TaxID=1314779 RepID=A0A6A6E3H8_9PEZI|nr:hypothetical protein K469DRAFT_739026 [Zopfia rhizophila CBS 207.26]